MYAKFKERQKKLEEALVRRLGEQRQKAKEKEEQEFREKIDLAGKVEANGGLWKTVDQMQEEYRKLKENPKMGKGKLLEVIKSQILYRKKVLKQSVHAGKDWTFSNGGRMMLTPLSSNCPTSFSNLCHDILEKKHCIAKSILSSCN